MDYTKVKALELECTCVNTSIVKLERLMRGAVRADKKKINGLVKNLLPELYEDLVLNFYNPYNYFRTKTHIILVWSGIEHFLRITWR